MSNIVGFPLSEHLRPEHALLAAKTEVDLNGCKMLLVLGEYDTGELMLIPSKMSIGEAKYLSARLKEYIAGIEAGL